MNVVDVNDIPISYLNYQQEESSDSSVLIIRIPCEAGTFLTANDVPEARILVRENGTSDAFQDVATVPLDLDPYAGSSQDFDMKVHTGAVVGIVPVAVNIRVTYNP